jgi:hypothetical protein
VTRARAALAFAFALAGAACSAPAEPEPAPAPDGARAAAEPEPAASTGLLRNIHQAQEWGLVHWTGDVDAGLARAKRESKPAFVLFQEVPG